MEALMIGLMIGSVAILWFAVGAALLVRMLLPIILKGL